MANVFPPVLVWGNYTATELKKPCYRDNMICLKLYKEKIGQLVVKNQLLQGKENLKSNLRLVNYFALF